MNKLQIGIIYKMKNVNYIGSTFNMRKRLANHNNFCHNPNGTYYNTPVYKHIRENKIYIELEPIFFCFVSSKKSLLMIEQTSIDKYDSIFEGYNCIRAYTSDVDRKKNEREYNTKYQQKNKDKIKLIKAKHYQNNKDKIKLKNANYRKENKEKISQRRKQKVNCDRCGKMIRKYGIPVHQRSLRCQRIYQENKYKDILLL